MSMESCCPNEVRPCIYFSIDDEINSGNSMVTKARIANLAGVLPQGHLEFLRTRGPTALQHD